MDIILGEKIDVNLDLYTIYLNWKPDTILKFKEIQNMFKGS